MPRSILKLRGEILEDQDFGSTLYAETGKFEPLCRPREMGHFNDTCQIHSET